MRNLLIVLVIGVMAAGTFGCAGTNYVVQRDLGSAQIIQGGRTGAFGTDNSWAYVVPTNQPEKVLLEESYTLTEDSWEQKCPDPKQRKNFKHREVKEFRTKEVPSGQSSPFAFGAGNPSTGNMVIPAAVNIGEAAVGYGIGGGDINVTNKAKSNAEINHSANQGDHHKEHHKKDP